MNSEPGQPLREKRLPRIPFMAEALFNARCADVVNA
jgi:hypothetical protein